MSGIGRVPSSPTTVTPDTDHTTTTTTTTTTPATTAPATARTPTSTRPTAPAAPPKASDIVPAAILTKYGLDPNKLETASKYEGDRWSVGYYPYDGNVQYVAFGKHKELFGNKEAMQDAYSYWESYGDTGSPSGSRIGSGTISEDDFEVATGVDISGDRPIDNKAYKLLREAGAPADAEFALRDKDGKQLSIATTDKLVPTIVKDGKFVEVEVRDEGQYFKNADGFPLSATIAPPEIADSLKPGEHLSTFGGNPVSCAAGLANIEVMQEERLPEESARKGEHAMTRLREMAERHRLIGEVRGLGLMIGVELVRDRTTKEPAAKEAAAVRRLVREAGVLIGVGGQGGNIVRIQPPLVIEDSALDRALDVVDDALGVVAKS